MALCAVAPLCAGCASAVDGSTQMINVATAPEAGAACTVWNERGKWPLVSPGAVVVLKSESVLTIRCGKPGWQDATVYASGRMSTAGMVGMMLPYVGMLNAAVDSSTGAAMQYPDAFTVVMKPAAAPVAQTPPAPH